MSMARSTADESFLSQIKDWLEADGELFVVVRLPNAGGSKSYEHFKSMSSFTDRLSQLASATSIVVCKGLHLPLRGIVTQSYVSSALNQIPDGSEWLIVRETRYTCGAASWFPDSVGDTHQELEAELQNDTYFGHPVRAGIVPPWWEGDSDTIVSAYVPNADGSVTPAAY